MAVCICGRLVCDVLEEGGVRRGNMRLSIFCWRWQACKCPSGVFTLGGQDSLSS